jgi:hypothetical protein
MAEYKRHISISKRGTKTGMETYKIWILISFLEGQNFKLALLEYAIVADDSSFFKEYGGQYNHLVELQPESRQIHITMPGMCSALADPTDFEWLRVNRKRKTGSYKNFHEYLE